MTKPRVDFAALTRYEQLGGKGCATPVRFRDGPTGLHVFKGMDFRTYLTHCDHEGDRTVRHMIDCWRNSEALLLKMPPHPNILPAPSVFVTITRLNGNGAPVVCSSLQPFYNHDDVGGAIEKSNKSGQRISPELKANWCGGMAEAVAHTHRVAKSYHMDIKPGNFLIANGDKRLILCDWGQVDAPPTTLAPEADGT